MPNGKQQLGLLSITDICQNDCIFCGLGKSNSGAVHRPLDQLKHQVALIREKGVRRLAFTGGEPTLHPNIVELVNYAASLGFDYLRIYTHGRNLSQHNLLESLVDAGLTHLMISLFGPNKDIHNQIAKSEAFDETVAGIKKASTTSLKIVVNTPVTNVNCGYLMDFLDVLDHVTTSETIWQLSDLYPTTEVLKNPSVHAEYVKMRQCLRKVLTEATIRGRSFLLQEFPLCVTFPWHTNAKELGYWGQLTMLIGDSKAPYKIRKARPWVAPDRFYHDSCLPCSFKGKCLGIPSSYHEQYSDTGFVEPF